MGPFASDWLLCAFAQSYVLLIQDSYSANCRTKGIVNNRGEARAQLGGVAKKSLSISYVFNTLDLFGQTNKILQVCNIYFY